MIVGCPLRYRRFQDALQDPASSCIVVIMSNGDEVEMPSPRTDDLFGEAFRAARTRAGLTQDQVVQAMTDRGFATFHQVTIYKIERGDRRVSVGEGLALAEIVGHSLGSLYESFGDSRAARVKRIADASGRIDADVALIAESVARLQVETAQLAQFVREFDAADQWTPEQTASEHFSYLAQLDLSKIAQVLDAVDSARTEAIYTAAGSLKE